jgi:hypothetical protein
MRRDIFISEIEPGGPAKTFQRCHEVPGLGFNSPTPFSVIDPCQPIHYRIQVGRNLQTEMFEVVTGVDDNQKVFTREATGKALSQFRPAYAPCQSQYHRSTFHDDNQFF